MKSVICYLGGTNFLDASVNELKYAFALLFSFYSETKKITI